MPTWLHRPGVQIVAICEPDAKRRHAALQTVADVHVYESLDLMLSGERLDFVDIASSPASHAWAAKQALEAGIHALVEKPLCLEPAERIALESLAHARGRVLMCVHNWKYAPPYRRAAEMVRAGELGTLRRLAFTRLRTVPAGGRSRAREAWRLEPAQGGGILIDHGWHVFYLMTWLVGGAGEPQSVLARLGFEPGSEADATAEIEVRFGEISASAKLSWIADRRSTTAFLEGDAASVEIDGDRLAVTTLATGRRSTFTVEDAPDDSYHRAWFAGVAEEFERAIAGGPASSEALQNLREARIALDLIVAARASARQGGLKVALS